MSQSAPNDNPYAAPVAPPAGRGEAGIAGGRAPAEIRGLYRCSCNIRAITALMAASCLLMMVILCVNVAQRPIASIGIGLPALLVLSVLATTGISIRAGWGRMAGMCFCSLMLVAIPIGVMLGPLVLTPLGIILGIGGLSAFLKAGRLFGDARISHRELKEAVRAAKRES